MTRGGEVQGVQHFRQLSVWRKSHALTLRVYAESESVHARFPALSSRLVRVAQAVPSLIAAGSGQRSGLRFALALDQAIGSARELDYLLTLTKDLGALASRDHARLEARTDEVVRMLVGLRQRVGVRQPRAPATSVTL